MLLKSCAHCGVLIPYGKTYCTDCEPKMKARREEYLKKHKRSYDRQYDKTKRDPKYFKFYHSQAWRKTAAGYLAAHGYRCERCGAIAEQVHHRMPIQTPEGWDRRFDYDNLELLCISCHNKEHKRFYKRKDTGVGKKV